MGLAWIPSTVVAALSQAVRNALQRSLKGRLSTNGASFTRFVFGLPFACVYLVALSGAGVGALPEPGPVFWAWLLAASVSQIAATSLLIHVMTARNFATGVAYAKTEVAQAAVFEILFLGARVTWMGAAGVLLATFAVMLMSVSRATSPMRALLVGWTERSSLLGLLAGGLFGVAAVGFATPFTELLAALAWLRVPRGLVEVTLFAWRYLFVLAPSTIRRTNERLQDITSSIEADVPETSTRVFILYRLGNGFARPGDTTEGQSRVDSRFDVQVRQSLPFLNFSGVIEEIDPERGKLKITVNIFGRNTPVELEYWQVEKG
jgi:hypothetical protein